VKQDYCGKRTTTLPGKILVNVEFHADFDQLSLLAYSYIEETEVQKELGCSAQRGG
jgi:hypothetical protein